MTVEALVSSVWLAHPPIQHALGEQVIFLWGLLGLSLLLSLPSQGFVKHDRSTPDSKENSCVCLPLKVGWERTMGCRME